MISVIDNINSHDNIDRPYSCIVPSEAVTKMSIGMDCSLNILWIRLSRGISESVVVIAAVITPGVELCWNGTQVAHR